MKDIGISNTKIMLSFVYLIISELKFYPISNLAILSHSNVAIILQNPEKKTNLLANAHASRQELLVIIM